MIPIILAGGAGTALWPLSREAYPKPFIRLPEGCSLLEKTVARAATLPGVQNLLTLSNREYYFKVRDSYVGIKHLSKEYLLEPTGRNTAPAICAAALYIRECHNPDAVMLVLPADHLIEDQTAFAEAVSQARELAEAGYLVTFGIPPRRPATDYGYIEPGTGVQVKRFVEKPDQQTAESYLASGGFLWNAGIFCFRADTLLEAMSRFAPAVESAVAACWQQTDHNAAPIELDAEYFALAPAVSIDHALLEHADHVAVVASRFDWRDIGSWNDMAGLSAADAQGNYTAGETVLVASRDCYVHSEDRLVAVVGGDNLIIADTPDALLVAQRDQVDAVTQVVQILKQRGHECYRLPNTVTRPWGTYTTLEAGGRFKIKRIVVHPGHALSLQMHHHRSEHWVVVSGTAKVFNDEREFLVGTNESTFISAGTRHRLSNPGVIDLVIIEVQSGDYVGENDIVRLEDDYGRVK